MELSDKYRWKIIAAAAFCYVIYAIVLQSIPPILGILIDLLHISYAEAGMLMSLALLPAIVLSFPGGLLVDDHRQGFQTVSDSAVRHTVLVSEPTELR